MGNKNIFIKKNFGIEKSGSIILTTVVQGTDVIVSSNPLCKKKEECPNHNGTHEILVRSMMNVFLLIA